MNIDWVIVFYVGTHPTYYTGATLGGRPQFSNEYERAVKLRTQSEAADVIRIARLTDCKAEAHSWM